MPVNPPILSLNDTHSSGPDSESLTMEASELSGGGTRTPAVLVFQGFLSFASKELKL